MAKQTAKIVLQILFYRNATIEAYFIMVFSFSQFLFYFLIRLLVHVIKNIFFVMYSFEIIFLTMIVYKFHAQKISLLMLLEYYPLFCDLIIFLKCCKCLLS